MSEQHFRYEYCVQINLGHRWLFVGRGHSMHQLEKYGEWWDKPSKAIDYLETCETEHDLRIVRRRVSPVEVME